MNVTIRVVGATFALATLLHSQEPAPADPLIRLSVNLVQIDAVVTDSSGKHVTDLKASDFEILEDHKRQRITTFSFIPGRRPPASSSTPDAVVREAVAGVSGTLALPRREDVQRAMVLIADDFSLSAQSMPYVRKAIAQFIDNRLLPGDLVSLMSASGGTGSLQRFTEDKHQLHAALDRVRWLPGNGLSPFQPIRMGDSASIGASGGLQTQQSRAEAHVRTYFSQGTAGAVRYAIQGLRQMPGRKALVLITEGFRYDSFWENVIEQANRAGVTIYMVDARGIVSLFMQAQDDVRVRTGAGVNPALGINGVQATRSESYGASKQGMERVAKETGGKLLSEDNDIGELLASTLDELGGYYLVGYQPPRGNYNSEFHKIDIRVRRRGVRVRARNGFHGALDDPVEESRGSRNEQLMAALVSPFEGAIPAPFHVLYGPQEGGRGRNHGAVLRGQVRIDAKALEFTRVAENRRQAVIDTVAAAFSADGKMAASEDRTFTVNLTDAELQETMADGLFYEATLSLPRSGPYQFRIALRDATSKRTGSASAFVEIPDFTRQRLALSSLALGGSRLRVFERGSEIAFHCSAVGAANATLQFEVRLTFGSERIYNGPRLTMAAQDRTKPMSVTGQVRLPATLPKGDYGMEVVVFDGRLSESQWVGFSLAP